MRKKLYESRLLILGLSRKCPPSRFREVCVFNSSTGWSELGTYLGTARSIWKWHGFINEWKSFWWLTTSGIFDYVNKNTFFFCKLICSHNLDFAIAQGCLSVKWYWSSYTPICFILNFQKVLMSEWGILQKLGMERTPGDHVCCVRGMSEKLAGARAGRKSTTKILLLPM